MEIEISELEKIMNVEIVNVFKDEGGTCGFALSDGTYIKAVIVSIDTIENTLNKLKNKKTVAENEVADADNKISILSNISVPETP